MPAARKAFHKWTTHDRELLCLLKTRLSREGFQDGVSAPSLDAQYQEMKTGGGGYEIYARITSLSDDDVKTEHRAHLRNIEQAIRSLRLKVQTRSTISKRPTQSQPNKPQKKKPHRTNRVREPERSDMSAEPEPEPVQSLVRPELQPFMHHHSPYFPSKEPTNTGTDNRDHIFASNDNDIVPPTPRIYIDSNGLPALARPLLLFRSTETVNLFRSRRYVDENKLVRPPFKFNSQEYRDEAWPHLQRHKIYPSPFISFATKARDAIGRIEIETSENLETKRFLAIFAFNDLEIDATRNFGPGSGPHPVGGLFSKTEISDLPKGYKGSGEWLAYGYISCQPLVVLDSVQAVSLAKAIRRFSVGNVTALSDISESLKDVPAKWKEAVSYVILRGYCASKLPKVGTPAYKEMMELVISGRRVTSMTTPIDLSCLSVADEESADKDDEAEEIIPPYQRPHPNEGVHCTAQSIPIEAPAKPVSLSLRRVNSVIQNLNHLASRPTLKELPQNTLEATPFWSPDPPESICAVSATVQPPLNQARALPLHAVVNIEEVDDDDDWDFVNDELEQSFVNSFPSASKRVEHLQSTNHLQATSEIDFDEEDKDYIIPSIEKDQLCNDEKLYGRGNFLRGLSQHAVSMTPPTQETPTKMPRNSISSRILKPCDDNVTSGITGQQAVATTSKFTPYQAYANRKITQIQNPVSERPGLARIISLNGHGSGSTIMNRNTSTSNLNGWPKTNIRTKIPVIVRKKIVDY